MSSQGLFAAAALALGAALVVVSQRAQPAPGARSAGERLLGPIAAAAASVQWVRANQAFAHNHPELGLARAESALALAPHSQALWAALFAEQALTLASREREPDVLRRRAWLEAALDTAAQAEALVPDPAELAWWQGLVLSTKAQDDPGLWPGGAPALLELAAQAFERASRGGHALAAQQARLAREAARVAH